jgi:glycosyltransferase involved in cell wall biosynthesis
VVGSGTQTEQHGAVAAPRRTVLMICAHEPRLDPRIGWTAEHAAREFDVTVLGFHREPASEPAFQDLDGYKIVRVPRVNRSPAYYFWRLGNLLPRRFFFIPALLGAAFSCLALCALLLRLAARSGRAMRRALPSGKGSSRLPPKGSAVPLPSAIAADPGLRALLVRVYYVVTQLRMQFSPAAAAFWNHIRLMDRKPEVVHCNDLDTLLVGALAKKHFGCRLVYDAHEYFPYCDPDGRWIDQKFFAEIERFLIRCCDGVVTVSPPLAEMMRAAYGLAKVHAIPNAEPWHKDQAPANFASPMTALAGGRIKFLFQGRFTRGRGVEEMIRAWALVDPSEAALFLRGPGNASRESAIDLARQLGLLNKSVYFLDPVTEDLLVAAAAEADVGMIPYLPLILNDRLACPNKLSQYMHAGLMVIANDLPYVRQVLEQGKAGLTYSSSDPSLARAVDRVIRDPELLRTCRANALGFARERFNWATFAWQLDALYRGQSPDEVGRDRPDLPIGAERTSPGSHEHPRRDASAGNLACSGKYSSCLTGI